MGRKRNFRGPAARENTNAFSWNPFSIENAAHHPAGRQGHLLNCPLQHHPTHRYSQVAEMPSGAPISRSARRIHLSRETFNAQHSTPNVQGPPVERWTLNVEC